MKEPSKDKFKSKSGFPRLSIITINLNNLEGLKLTIQNVLGQTWQDFEHIIVDGGSTDGSYEYLQRNEQRIGSWTSEPDSGIYNAMNKGLKRANGEYVLFLNSGDAFCSNEVLSRFLGSISERKDLFYGNVYLINEKGERELLELPSQISFSFFYLSTITHQAVFIRRCLFERVSFYNEKYTFVSDWEFFLLSIFKHNCSFCHLPFPVVDYNSQGMSSQIENLSIMQEERQQVLEEHFPLFIRDYEELFKLRNTQLPSRIQSFLKLESNGLTRKINTLLFKIFKIK